MSLRTLVLACAWVMASVGAALAGDDGLATVRVERPKAVSYHLERMEVYVNDALIGNVGYNETKDLKFLPKKDGKNTLRFVIICVFGDVKTRDYEMGAHPDWVLKAVAELEVGAFKNKLSIALSTLEAPEPAKATTPLNLGLPSNVKILSVSCDKEMRAKVLRASPVYNLPVSQEKVVEDTVKVAHSVTVTKGTSLDGELKLGWGPIEAHIRGSISKSTGRTYSTETERKRSVKVIGNGMPVRVVWTELYVTGKATIEVSGKQVVVPFEFREDFDLLVEAVSGSPN